MLLTHTIVNARDAFHSEFLSDALRRHAIRSVPDRGDRYQTTGDDAPVANLCSTVLSRTTVSVAALSRITHSLWKTFPTRLQSAGAAFRIVL